MLKTFKTIYRIPLLSCIFFKAYAVYALAYYPGLRYEQYTNRYHAQFRVISIDPKYFEIRIVSDEAGTLTRPCEMAQRHHALVAINGGFFAFTDSSASEEEPVADGNLILSEQSYALSEDLLSTLGWSQLGAALLMDLGKNTTEKLPSWVDFAINGLPALLKNGEIIVWDDATLNAINADIKLPRSGICVAHDGNFKFFTASKASIYTMALFAKEIGCKDAINIDGGPSTSLDYLGQSLMHRSCANERPVHNSIIAVSKN